MERFRGWGKDLHPRGWRTKGKGKEQEVARAQGAGASPCCRTSGVARALLSSCRAPNIRPVQEGWEEFRGLHPGRGRPRGLPSRRKEARKGKSLPTLFPRGGVEGHQPSAAGFRVSALGEIRAGEKRETGWSMLTDLQRVLVRM